MWFHNTAPQGLNNGTTPGNALQFNQNTVAAAINAVDPADPLVRIILSVQGIYTITQPINPNGANNGPPPANRQVVILPVNPLPGATTIRYGYQPGSYYPELKEWIFNISGVDHVTIKDLTFDCNFQSLTASDPAVGNSPKGIAAIRAAANTVLIKNVRVINPGGRDQVPLSYLHPAGSEDFVISVDTLDWRRLPPVDNSTHPFWDGQGVVPNSEYTVVVDGCDISQFHGILNGYISGIRVGCYFPIDAPGDDPNNPTLPFAPGGITSLVPNRILGDQAQNTGYRSCYNSLNAPKPSIVGLALSPLIWTSITDLNPAPGASYDFDQTLYRSSRNKRFGLIRHCQVAQFNVGEAFNLPVTSGVVVEENLVADGDAFFNADTGPCKNLDIRNNLALDIMLGGYFGVPAINNSNGDGFNRLNMANNWMRLKNSEYRPAYFQYSYQNANPVPSASKFPLGRLIPSLCAGLQLRSAEEVRYTGNHLTTRPYFAGVGPPPNKFRPNWAAPGGYEDRILSSNFDLRLRLLAVTLQSDSRPRRSSPRQLFVSICVEFRRNNSAHDPTRQRHAHAQCEYHRNELFHSRLCSRRKTSKTDPVADGCNWSTLPRRP